MPDMSLKRNSSHASKDKDLIFNLDAEEFFPCLQ
jgi:hypothetical protein